MANSNPNDTKVEQQRAESAEAALKSQTEDNHTEDSEAAADRIADNLENAKKDKQQRFNRFDLNVVFHKICLINLLGIDLNINYY